MRQGEDLGAELPGVGPVVEAMDGVGYLTMKNSGDVYFINGL